MPIEVAFLKKEGVVMGFWIDFFKDKRFSLDFKIANLIVMDSLRNYLATDLIVLQQIADSRARKVERDIQILFNHKYVETFPGCVNDEQMKYKMIVHPQKANDGTTYWTARCPDIHECVGGGDTPQEAVKDLQKNLKVYMEFL